MSEEEFEIFGSVYNGCEVNLIRFCGLELTDEQLNTLWGNTTEYHLLIAAGADLEEDTFDEGMPGQSDIGYTTVVTDSFKDHLKEVILNIVNESWSPEVEESSVERALESVVDSDRNAAEQGHAEAQFILGIAYETGDGVLKDHVEAVKWFRKSAEQSYAPAQRLLGYAYETGKGIAKDAEKAVELYRKAAEQGDAKAQEMLGVMLAAGNGVAKDYVEAVKWFRKSAEHGYVEALRCLGVAYENGKGVSENHVLAAMWYRIAAEKGHPAAQRDLGWMYAKGKGVSKDDAEAVKWIRKAAEQGLISAQLNLCDIYCSGNSIDITGFKDDVEAYAWLTVTKSDGNGNEAVKEALEFLQSKLTQEELTDAKRRATNLTLEIEPKNRTCRHGC